MPGSSPSSTSPREVGFTPSRFAPCRRDPAVMETITVPAHWSISAITVDDVEPTALYSPGRDEQGALEPAEITAALVDLYLAGMAGDVADQLIALG